MSNRLNDYQGFKIFYEEALVGQPTISSLPNGFYGVYVNITHNKEYRKDPIKMDYNKEIPKKLGVLKENLQKEIDQMQKDYPGKEVIINLNMILETY